MHDYSKTMQARNDAFDAFEDALKAFVTSEQALKVAEYNYSEAKNKYEASRTIFFVKNDEAVKVQALHEAELIRFEQKKKEILPQCEHDIDAPLAFRSTD